jgi:hypothetical protein
MNERMKEIAETLRSEVNGAAEYLKGLGEAEVSRNRGQGKWIKKEILGHLIDSAVNNHERFVRAQFANPFAWPGYDQVAWVSVHRYRERSWSDLVDLWVALNRQVVVVVEGIPTEKLDTMCQIGEAAQASLEWWIHDYIRHLKHHLAQLKSE